MVSEKVQEKLDKGYFLIKAIIEVVGRPKEHIVDALKMVIDKIKDEEKMILVKGDLYDAKEGDFEFEKKGQLWSTFAELEILVENNDVLSYFCIEYLPSSIEIIEPKEMTFKIKEYTETINNFINRLHNIDMVLKNSRAENQLLNKNAKMLLRNIILVSLKDKSKDIAEMSRLIGISEKEIVPFIDELIEQGIILKENDKYSLKK